MKNTLILLLIILLFMSSFLIDDDSKAEHRNYTSLQYTWQELELNELNLPFKLTFMRKSMLSPMFSEYYRQLITKTTDGETRTHQMFSNPGGKTFINIFLLRDISKKEILWLKDRWSDHYLDIDSIKVIGKMGDEGGEQNIEYKTEFKYVITDTTYLGCIDARNSKELAFISNSLKDKETIEKWGK